MRPLRMIIHKNQGQAITEYIILVLCIVIASLAIGKLWGEKLSALFGDSEREMGSLIDKKDQERLSS